MAGGEGGARGLGTATCATGCAIIGAGGGAGLTSAMTPSKFINVLYMEDVPRLSRLAAELPTYSIVKDKYELSREKLPAALAKLRKRWPDAVVNEIDGLRLDLPDGWLHVRGSNTEPVVRVYSEARSEADTEKLSHAAKQWVLQ